MVRNRSKARLTNPENLLLFRLNFSIQGLCKIACDEKNIVLAYSNIRRYSRIPYQCIKIKCTS